MLSCQAAPSIHRMTSTSHTCWSAQLKTNISCNTCEKKHFCAPGGKEKSFRALSPVILEGSMMEKDGLQLWIILNHMPTLLFI